MKKILVIIMIALPGHNFIYAQTKPAFYSGVYKNIFHEAGYNQKDIDAKVDKAYYDLFKSWQEEYAKHMQSFLQSKGVNTFDDQFNPDGSKPDSILPAGGFKKLRHSLGLVATSATTELIHKDDFAFVNQLWNAKLEPYSDGYFDPYYDGLLYLFSLMHLSGKYQIIKPGSY
jgi:oligosaccharide reducing-end xylanase